MTTLAHDTAPSGTTLDQAIREAGERIARDLAQQAGLTPEQAADAAGCTTPGEVAAWIAEHRP
jgi:hypothetical protein